MPVLKSIVLTILLGYMVQGEDKRSPSNTRPNGFLRFYFARPIINHEYGYGNLPEDFQSMNDGRQKQLNFRQSILGRYALRPTQSKEGSQSEMDPPERIVPHPFTGQSPEATHDAGGLPASLYDEGQQSSGLPQRSPAMLPYPTATQGLRGVALNVIPLNTEQYPSEGDQLAGVSLTALTNGQRDLHRFSNTDQKTYRAGGPPRGRPVLETLYKIQPFNKNLGHTGAQDLATSPVLYLGFQEGYVPHNDSPQIGLVEG
ncbi:uncharacterized protein LOC143251819 isoform X2 [Tachypleus tridentatus]|uniref:uncharacterized protein LOC143251819 isoform X2 n=1 Tax=Tachypleus tridentatus TaxID=6853 RepID=UPI003FD47CD5